MSVVETPTEGFTEAQGELARLARQVNLEAGIEESPPITAEELQVRMRQEGVRPEEDILTRELLRMRYGEDA